MSIAYCAESRVFSLTTAHHVYQMKVAEGGVLLHLYYGVQTGMEMDYRLRYADRGFSGNPYEQRKNRGFSLDTLPQEYAGSGVGDYRVPAVCVVSENGSRCVDLRYCEHQIYGGREALPGLPYVREDEDTETLKITMKDPIIGFTVDLIYRVYPEKDVIVRSACLTNTGENPLQ